MEVSRAGCCNHSSTYLVKSIQLFLDTKQKRRLRAWFQPRASLVDISISDHRTGAAVQ